MNYDKATIFYVLVPYIRRVGNRPEKLAISTLLELWYHYAIQWLVPVFLFLLR